MKSYFRSSIKDVVPTLVAVLVFLATITAVQRCTAQEIYVTQNVTRNTVNVYVTPYRSQADVVVFVEPYYSRRNTDSTRWYFSFPNIDTPRNINIRFVQYYSQADLVVFFTRYRSSARWKRPHKKYMLLPTK